MSRAPERVIGIIGLGLVGRALSARLLQAGYGVVGYDLSASACAQASALGVEVLQDGREVALRVQTLFLALLTSDDRRALCWGQQRLAEVLAPGTTILDATTARPEDIEEDHRRLAAAGVRLVDVCLSGSSQAIGAGRALALVGDERERADYAPVLAAFSKEQYFLGAPGAGCRVKLIVNLVFGLNRIALAEALGLASKGGFDLKMILDVLRAGETYSVAMDTKGPMMISGLFAPPVARLAQHAKDVHLIREYAHSIGAYIPITELHEKLIDDLVERGAGELDNAAIFKAFVREQGE